MGRASSVTITTCLICHLGPRPACAGVLSRHVRGKRAAKTAWILLNFQSYVKYHIKVFLRLSKKKNVSSATCSCTATCHSAQRSPPTHRSVLDRPFPFPLQSERNTVADAGGGDADAIAVHPEPRPEPDAGAAGDADGGRPEREATGHE